MARTALQQAMSGATRRCSVPRDLAPITEVGDEADSGGAAEQIWSRIEAIYRSGMHPGVQLHIRRGGAVVVDRAIGHARGNLPGRRFDPEVAVPMRLDTPINLFSAAKPVTAMVMHKLDEQGAIGLDDRVADHLPGFARHGKHGITVRHLLTHRAGIPSLPVEAFDLDLLGDHERVEQLVCDLRPVAAPGEKPAYHAVSGGFVLEALTRRSVGRSLRDVLATDIKGPLGAEWLDLGVSPDQVGLVAQNVETGFPLGPATGPLLRRAIGSPWRSALRMSNDARFLSGVIPSGNVIVTARDVGGFYQCLLDGGAVDGVQVFAPETVERAIRAEHHDLPFDRMLGLPMRYSPGFMLGTDSFSLYGWNHPRIFGHLGLSNVFTWADPDRDLVVALLTTGKPILGTHLVSLPQLIASIHEAFPANA